MELDEIRAEIEQRRQRARDLKIRDTLWDLYDRHFSRYPELMEKDQSLVYPEVREAFDMSGLPSTQQLPKGTLVQFQLGPSAYQLRYLEKKKTERWDDERFSSHTTTPAVLRLAVNDLDVLEFIVCRSVRNDEWGTASNESMGEIARFIEGPWVAELTDLLKRIRKHEKGVWDQRNAPALDEMKKRFGL